MDIVEFLRARLDADEAPYPCDTVRALASVYADHPDHNPAWSDTP